MFCFRLVRNWLLLATSLISLSGEASSKDAESRVGGQGGTRILRDTNWVSGDFSQPLSTTSNLMFGLSAWPKMDPRYANTLAEGGVTILRADIYLYDIIPTEEVYNQGPERWNWNPPEPTESISDSAVTAFTNAGIKVMLIIHGFPEWMGTPKPDVEIAWDKTDDSLPVTNFAALQNAYAQVYKHYKDRVSYFEIMNEPDLLMSYSEYETIYETALAGMKSVGLTSYVGGPAGLTSYVDWIPSMLNNPSIGSDLQFASWHNYDSRVGDQNVELVKSSLSSSSNPNLPLFVSEWNYYGGGGPMCNGDPKAVSWSAINLSAMMEKGATGAFLFATNNNTTSYDAYLRDAFVIINPNGSFTPEMATWRLLSKSLGLGVGKNTIYACTNSDSVSWCDAAVNANGDPVAWVINDSDESVTSDLNLTNVSSVGLSGNVRVASYLANASNSAIAPVSTQVLAVSDNTLTTSITVPARSVYGMVFGSGSETPPGGNTDVVGTPTQVDQVVMSFTGSWDTWQPEPSLFFGDSKGSNTPGSTASYTFTGTGVTWIGQVDSNFGEATVAIDGITKATVDCYSSTNKSQQSLYEITGLERGTHTITITVLGSHNPSSSDSHVEVDALVINP